MGTGDGDGGDGFHGLERHGDAVESASEDVVVAGEVGQSQGEDGGRV